MVGRGGAELRGRMMIASRGMRAFVRAHIILFMRSFLHSQPIPKFIEPFYKPLPGLALSVVSPKGGVIPTPEPESEPDFLP